ncbi:pyruvate dehydrogenase E2 component (dihydrolipoamide acetyltransferase) [Lewinella aquimaris]|uniref:Dihydrolipoamide acetyltransferase component of pyruvate dehydrogenase complex n=1 Tax=Neolewinella aquimaris TaxID=1835722 RepID=A0A840E5V4_9BACT|nr:dihydrolipoamide acetyltransferase family protein [Neolewinella aquimaris]MBB4079343.1 pyruvate dehydrogenase E2 component (dihydrolipoamide acetyltransferase) [Neolewinella aquimaris]
MAEVIRMPRMSDTMEEGNIVSWLVEEGEAVEPGQTLAEVETDKATMELDSFFEGTLLHIAVKEGAVPINGVIAVIGEEGEDWQAAIDGASDNGSSSESDAKEAPAEETKEAADTSEATESTGAADEDRVKASPLARAMAKDAGLDLATLIGSGEGGRIVKRDIEDAQSTSAKPATAKQAQPTTPQPVPAQQPSPNVDVEKPQTKVPAFSFGGGEANFEDVPVSQMRKVIARRLGESKFSAPHFYVTVEVEMSKVWEMRKRLNEVASVKISFNDLVVKACAVNLRKHPVINSSWMGDKIRVNHDVNIGVAVAIPDGLLVPVVRYADMKSLSQINSEVKELAGRAKNKKLSQDEMTGNTFTISNLGMFGIEDFTAIINPPDASILAVGGINDKPVVRDGAVVPGKIMKLTLSSDHRVVDGASAAQFLNDVKATLEEPIRLMV